MKRAIIFFGALLIAIASIAQSSNQEQYKAAKKLYDAGKYEEAYPTFKALAEKGDKDGIRMIGNYYHSGYSPLNKDWKKSYDLYQKAADKGDGWAMSNIGLMYHDGEYVEQDYQQAYNWYMKAVDKGNDGAMCNLGVLYEDRNTSSGKPDYNKAYEWYKKAADKGNVTAMCNIGSLYENGKTSSGEPDYNKAYEWYKKAADKGSAKAMTYIAFLYWNNQLEDVEKLPKALYIDNHTVVGSPTIDSRWYERLSQDTREKGVELDDNEASGHIDYTEEDIEDFKKPIVGTDGKINLNLEPASETERWLLAAARQDSANGLYWLARYYYFHRSCWTGSDLIAKYRGIGNCEISNELISLFRAAARNGSEDAQAICGWLLIVKRDYKEAEKWLNMAKINGAHDVEDQGEDGIREIDIDVAIMLCHHFASTRDYYLSLSQYDGAGGEYIGITPMGKDGNVDTSKGYVYVSVEDQKGEKWGWIKLSLDGNLLGKTPLTSNPENHEVDPEKARIKLIYGVE